MAESVEISAPTGIIDELDTRLFKVSLQRIETREHLDNILTRRFRWTAKFTEKCCNLGMKWNRFSLSILRILFASDQIGLLNIEVNISPN
ncbi:MAG: hypothetical protein P1U58_13850 [Verrucomicrobiales bacterium]|nr:hypothetical protein [Verrucomicrobiales bacterium]